MSADANNISTDEIRSKCAEIYALKGPDEGIEALRKALTVSDRAKISKVLLDYHENTIDTEALLRKLGDLIDTARKEGYDFKR
tara:strand:+ start:1330 stop:1578 length:249 start_codon:yes stop_codon:yes gene_type:complete